MSKEAPKGIRANLLGSYRRLEESALNFEDEPDETKTNKFKKLLFGLCFFHAVVQERCKFGPLGWNIPYAFSEPDLKISQDQLKIFCADETVPYQALNYLVAHCNYGGRVTDDKDRRCIETILTDFYTPKILDDSYRFSPSGTYYAPPPTDKAGYLAYVQNLPLLETPECFGLHDNANLTSAMKEASGLLDTALTLVATFKGTKGDHAGSGSDPTKKSDAAASEKRKEAKKKKRKKRRKSSEAGADGERDDPLARLARSI